jgi:mRNA interferase RelE/StbE
MERLPRSVRIRVWEAILELRVDPRPHGARPLAGQRERRYRIRVGEYRILYQIDDRAQSVVVVEVGHRSSVYRGLHEEEAEYDVSPARGAPDLEG